MSLTAIPRWCAVVLAPIWHWGIGSVLSGGIGDWMHHLSSFRSRLIRALRGPPRGRPDRAAAAWPCLASRSVVLGSMRDCIVWLVLYGMISSGSETTAPSWRGKRDCAPAGQAALAEARAPARNSRERNELRSNSTASSCRIAPACSRKSTRGHGQPRLRGAASATARRPVRPPSRRPAHQRGIAVSEMNSDPTARPHHAG